MARGKPEVRRRMRARASAKRVHVAVVLGALTFIAACTREGKPEPPREAAAAALPAAAGPRATVALDAEDGQWTMPIKSYSAIRYSQLAEITAANVRNLRQAWTFSTSVMRGHEEPPPEEDMEEGGDMQQEGGPPRRTALLPGPEGPCWWPCQGTRPPTRLTAGDRYRRGGPTTCQGPRCPRRASWREPLCPVPRSSGCR